uniref:Uncharacterized protein n=1 Tax=Anguilla anguilla TaxID=7936 RepID=A0A0E9RQM3_ANGAN
MTDHVEKYKIRYVTKKTKLLKKGFDG